MFRTLEAILFFERRRCSLILASNLGELAAPYLVSLGVW